MDTATAYTLNAATADFYRRQADSFSATRRAPWPGWDRLLAGPAGRALSGLAEARVLDVGCGNLRFERFLAQRLPDVSWRFLGVDNCPLLVGDPPANLEYRQADIVGAVLSGHTAPALEAAPCQLVACFGFMHHVPGRQNRVRLLRDLAGRVAPGGFLAVSFWQFLNSPDLAERAAAAHGRGTRALAAAGFDPAQLEEGDYLLGWQHAPDAIRYCHAFTPREIDALVADAGLETRVADRFESDGRTGNLNAYLVLAAEGGAAER